MLDIRKNKEGGYMIKCDSCGRSALVSEDHGRYCPFCGPETITPITVTPVEEWPHADFFLKVRSLIDDAINDYNISYSKLENDGEVFYMNGNDSTLFDYGMNDRLCEIGVFYKESGFYAVKVLVGKGQTVVYVYPDEANPQDYRKVNCDVIIDTDDLDDLAQQISDLEEDFVIGPRTKDWDRPLSVLEGQLRELNGFADDEPMSDCSITGLIMTFGEDDISLNMLDLPEDLQNRIFNLVEPYCTCSIRGSRESIAKEITD